MTKSRLTLLALMMGLSMFGCKKLFKGKGGNTDAGSIDIAKMMASMDAGTITMTTTTADSSGSTTTTTTTPTMPDMTAGASCPKAVKCCKVLSGDQAAACDSLAKAPEVTCATTLTSYRKSVKVVKPKRLSECD